MTNEELLVELQTMSANAEFMIGLMSEEDISYVDPDARTALISVGVLKACTYVRMLLES